MHPEPKVGYKTESSYLLQAATKEDDCYCNLSQNKGANTFNFFFVTHSTVAAKYGKHKNWVVKLFLEKKSHKLLS